LTWSQIATLAGTTAIYGLDASPIDQTIIAACGNGHVFNSYDLGVSWKDLGLLPAQTLLYCALWLSNEKLLIGSLPGGAVWRSVDKGKTFVSSGNLFGVDGVLALEKIGSTICLAGCRSTGLILRSTI